MSKKTTFMTGLTIVSIVFVSGFLIPTIIEGINIGRNVENYNVYDQHLDNGDYINYNWYVRKNERLYISISSQNTIDYDETPVIFAIMSEIQFNYWLSQGASTPQIQNCTLYIKQSDINIINSQLRSDRDYYFIFFNDNVDTIQIFVDITLIPWGHIIATSIVGMGFIIFAAILLLKIAFTFYFIKKENKEKDQQIHNRGNNTNNSTIENDEAELQPKVETFCVSCGAPVTPKTGRYCQNCGSSVSK